MSKYTHCGIRGSGLSQNRIINSIWKFMKRGCTNLVYAEIANPDKDGLSKFLAVHICDAPTPKIGKLICQYHNQNYVIEIPKRTKG